MTHTTSADHRQPERNLSLKKPTDSKGSASPIFNFVAESLHGARIRDVAPVGHHSMVGTVEQCHEEAYHPHQHRFLLNLLVWIVGQLPIVLTVPSSDSLHVSNCSKKIPATYYYNHFDNSVKNKKRASPDSLGARMCRQRNS